MEVLSAWTRAMHGDAQILAAVAAVGFAAGSTCVANKRRVGRSQLLRREQ